MQDDAKKPEDAVLYEVVASANINEYPIVLMVDTGDVVRFERFLDRFLKAAEYRQPKDEKLQLGLALIRAVERNDIAIVRILYKYKTIGVGLFSKRPVDSTIAVAITRGHLEIVDFLLDILEKEYDDMKKRTEKEYDDMKKRTENEPPSSFAYFFLSFRLYGPLHCIRKRADVP